MTPVAYSVAGERTSPRWASAFASGCGGAVEPDDRLHDGPVAMFGSPARWSLLQRARRERRDWYYGDHGYFKRYTYYRCTRNAWQHDGLDGDDNPARLSRLGVKIQPWRIGGRYILICPPDKEFATLMGFNADVWLADTMATITEATDRPIVVRLRAAMRTTPLSAHLADAWCLVTYMSNAAVEAVLSGVPVFCTGPCAGATMGLSNLAEIERPFRPTGRRQWAARLANNQWTLDEMRRGDLWRAIGRA